MKGRVMATGCPPNRALPAQGCVPCGEGLGPLDWDFTPSLFSFTAECVCNLQLPNK